MAKKISLDSSSVDPKMIKQLRGLYRIMYDLDSVAEMCKVALSEKDTFLTYQGIIITYRKCFDKDSSRGASLKEKVHLNGLSEEKKMLHKELVALGNKYVAHPVSEDYDIVSLCLILNKEAEAVSIDVQHDIREPLEPSDYKQILVLVDGIRANLTKSIFDLTKKIIDDYNAERGKKAEVLYVVGQT